MPQSTPSPGALRILDANAAKAADSCQRQIQKGSVRLASSGLKRLSKCVSAALRCVQTKPGDDKCLDKAADRCGKELGKLPGDESKFRSAVAKKCGGVLLDDLFGPQGLGYDAALATCDLAFGVALGDADAVAECLVRQHRCRVEQIFATQLPRASELLGVLGRVPAPTSCLADIGGTGIDIGDPDGDGRALDKCTKEITGAAAQLVSRRLKTLQRCVGTAFTCVQKKPGDEKCLLRAVAKCGSALARMPATAAKLGQKIDKKCDASQLDFGVLAVASGGNVDGLADACATVGVDPVLTLEDYKTCLFRQHECAAEAMVRLQAPRVDELMALLGQPFGLPFCGP